MDFCALDLERTVQLFLLIADTCNNIFLCIFPTAFNLLENLALILMLLSYVDHLMLSCLPLSWKERMFVTAA